MSDSIASPCRRNAILLAIGPMREHPSRELLELLARLRLATPHQVRAVARRVGRLAGGLPHFDTVWIDALAQARRLTPFQAREINAGCGDGLAVGPYRVCAKRPGWGYAECFLGRKISELSGREPKASSRKMLLLTAQVLPQDVESVREQLTTLLTASQQIASQHFPGISEFDLVDGNLWLATEAATGIGAADWMVENGRFPPLVVMHIARQMLVGLCELERLGLVHGDLNASQLTLRSDGVVEMSPPGIRGILRPIEGFSTDNLPPECYESLAPERVIGGESVSTAGDLFACGCVWWQLLTGRPAIAGGNSFAKLKSAAEARIPDVRQLAPDAPPVLAEVIAACTARRPEDRPHSFAEVASILGPPSDLGTRMIARCLKKPERWLLARPRVKRRHSRLRLQAVEVMTVAVCIFVMLGAWRLLARPSSLSPAILAARAAMPVRPVSPPAKQLSQSEAVVPAAFVDSRTSPPDPVPGSGRKEPLILPANRRVRLETLSPLPGQRVQGEGNSRVQVATPPGGLVIDAPDVVFANIDFVATESSPSDPLLVLRTTTAQFEGCTFRGSGETAAGPAIVWEPSPSSQDEWDAAADEVRCLNCVFYAVDAAIERRRSVAATIDCANTLHAVAGPLVRICCDDVVESVSLEISECTLRETGAVLDVSECDAQWVRRSRFAIIATDCVLAPRTPGALIHLPIGCKDVLRKVRWIGRDSLMEVKAALVAERSEDGSVEPLDDLMLDAAGLIRSPFGFAGEDIGDPSASRLHRWLAPRQSLDPPGIDPGLLPEADLDLTNDHHDLGLR